MSYNLLIIGIIFYFLFKNPFQIYIYIYFKDLCGSLKFWEENNSFSLTRQGECPWIIRQLVLVGWVSCVLLARDECKGSSLENVPLLNVWSLEETYKKKKKNWK